MKDISFWHLEREIRLVGDDKLEYWTGYQWPQYRFVEVGTRIGESLCRILVGT